MTHFQCWLKMLSCYSHQQHLPVGLCCRSNQKLGSAELLGLSPSVLTPGGAQASRLALSRLELVSY